MNKQKSYQNSQLQIYPIISSQYAISSSHNVLHTKDLNLGYAQQQHKQQQQRNHDIKTFEPCIKQMSNQQSSTFQSKAQQQFTVSNQKYVPNKANHHHHHHRNATLPSPASEYVSQMPISTRNDGGQKVSFVQSPAILDASHDRHKSRSTTGVEQFLTKEAVFQDKLVTNPTLKTCSSAYEVTNQNNNDQSNRYNSDSQNNNQNNYQNNYTNNQNNYTNNQNNYTNNQNNYTNNQNNQINNQNNNNNNNNNNYKQFISQDKHTVAIETQFSYSSDTLSDDSQLQVQKPLTATSSASNLATAVVTTSPRSQNYIIKETNFRLMQMQQSITDLLKKQSESGKTGSESKFFERVRYLAYKISSDECTAEAMRIYYDEIAFLQDLNSENLALKVYFDRLATLAYLKAQNSFVKNSLYLQHPIKERAESEESDEVGDKFKSEIFSVPPLKLKRSDDTFESLQNVQEQTFRALTEANCSSQRKQVNCAPLNINCSDSFKPMLFTEDYMELTKRKHSKTEHSLPVTESHITHIFTQNKSHQNTNHDFATHASYRQSVATQENQKQPIFLNTNNRQQLTITENQNNKIQAKASQKTNNSSHFLTQQPSPNKNYDQNDSKREIQDFNYKNISIQQLQNGILAKLKHSIEEGDDCNTARSVVEKREDKKISQPSSAGLHHKRSMSAIVDGKPSARQFMQLYHCEQEFKATSQIEEKITDKLTPNYPLYPLQIKDLKSGIDPMQQNFYSLCLDIKLRLPRQHSAQKIPVSYLFRQMQRECVPQAQWGNFIQKQFQNPQFQF